MDGGSKTLGSYDPWSEGEGLLRDDGLSSAPAEGQESIQDLPTTGAAHEDGSKGRWVTRDLVIAAVKKDNVEWLEDAALRDFTKLVYRVDDPVVGRWVPANKVSELLVELMALF